MKEICLLQSIQPTESSSIRLIELYKCESLIVDVGASVFVHFESCCTEKV